MTFDRLFVLQFLILIGFKEAVQIKPDEKYYKYLNFIKMQKLYNFVFIAVGVSFVR